jgi:MFS family permease
MRALVNLVSDWLRLARSPRARPYLLVTFLVDSAFIFVFLVAIQSYLPEQHGGGASLPGYALAAYGAAKLAAQLFGGRLSDWVGARRGLLTGLALVVLGQASFFAAAAAPEIALPAAAVYGLGAAVLWPAVYALASTTFAPTERAKLTSAMTLTTGAALIVGLGMGLVLPARFPYTAAMALPLAAVVLAFVSAAPLRPRAEQQALSGPSHAVGSLRDVLESALKPQRLAFAAVMLLQTSAVGALLAVFRSYGRDVLDLSFRQELLLLTPAAVLGAAAVVAGGVLADRVGRAPLLAFGFLVTGVAVWFLSSITNLGAVILLAAAGGMGYGLALPSVTATAMDLAHALGRGTLLAWFMAIEGLGHTAGPALGAWLNSIEGTATVLRVAAVLFAGVAPAALMLLISTRVPSRDTADDAPREREPVLLELVQDGP